MKNVFYCYFARETQCASDFLIFEMKLNKNSEICCSLSAYSNSGLHASCFDFVHTAALNIPFVLLTETDLLVHPVDHKQQHGHLISPQFLSNKEEEILNRNKKILVSN